MITSLLLAAMAQATTPATPGPGGPAALHRADANGDGVVIRAEAMAQADAMFARMDGNHDGKVTPEDRRAAMDATRAERRGDGPGRGGMGRGGDREITLEQARQMAAQRFDRLDTNKDGRLDATELAAARRDPRPPCDGDTPPPPPPAQ